MFCIYCGTNNPDDAVFCRGCGRQQPAANHPQLPNTAQASSPYEEPVAPTYYGQQASASPYVESQPTPPPVYGQTQLSPNPYAPNAPVAPQPARHISRRAVLIGLGGLVALGAVGGGIVWWQHAQRPPIGTTIYTYRGHSSIVWAVAWSPDGQRIASGAGAYQKQGSDTAVHVWDTNTGNLIVKLHGHTDLIPSVAWSPDGQHIVSASLDKTARVWDASTGNNTFTYRGHANWVITAAWAPDSTRVVSGGGDSTGQTTSGDTAVRVWEAV